MRISIKDTGIGIQDTSKIGMLFQALEVVQNVNQNGIGFGISISRKIMMQLFGSLEINNNSTLPGSMKQKGVTVRIEFPFEEYIISNLKNEMALSDSDSMDEISVFKSPIKDDNSDEIFDSKLGKNSNSNKYRDGESS